jgi:hypothetical protein
MQKLKQLFVTYMTYLRSPDYWVGFIIGAILFIMGFLALTVYNQSNGFTSLAAIPRDASFYHPAVVSAALEWPCGFPITGLLVAISAGFLRIRSPLAKPLGFFLLFVIFMVYLVIAIFTAIGVNVEGPSQLVD